MKQQVTKEQLNELGKKAYKKLEEWWGEHESDWVSIWAEGIPAKDMNPLLSIGQMIEFLAEKDAEGLGAVFWNHHTGSPAYDEYDSGWQEFYGGETLCDDFWEAVKIRLERDEI